MRRPLLWALSTAVRDATVRHAGPSGDTGEYDPAQVFEMAYQLASMVAKRTGIKADAR